MARPPAKLAGEELLQYAVALLARRSLSAGEVRTRVARRAADPDSVETVIGRLREYGYLNDERFAESFASVRRDSGSFGASRVLRDLRTRRVSSTVATKAVEEAFSDVNESEAIAAWLERKYKTVDLGKHLKDPKHLASVYRRLRYAGFSSAASVRALRNWSERAEELEDDPEE